MRFISAVEIDLYCGECASQRAASQSWPEHRPTSRGEQPDEFGFDVAPEVRCAPMLRERGLRLVALHERELVWVVDALVSVALQGARLGALGSRVPREQLPAGVGGAGARRWHPCSAR